MGSVPRAAAMTFVTATYHWFHKLGKNYYIGTTLPIFSVALTILLAIIVFPVLCVCYFGLAIIHCGYDFVVYVKREKSDGVELILQTNGYSIDYGVELSSSLPSADSAAQDFCGENAGDQSAAQLGAQSVEHLVEHSVDRPVDRSEDTKVDKSSNDAQRRSSAFAGMRNPLQPRREERTYDSDDEIIDSDDEDNDGRLRSDANERMSVFMSRPRASLVSAEVPLADELRVLQADDSSILLGENSSAKCSPRGGSIDTVSMTSLDACNEGDEAVVFFTEKNVQTIIEVLVAGGSDPLAAEIAEEVKSLRTIVDQQV